MATPADLFELRIIIEGDVQGVNFRWFALQRAKALGLVGWVKNTHDNKVEIEAEGTKDNLQVFYRDCRIGPAWARVDKTDEQWKKIIRLNYSDFEIKYV